MRLITILLVVFTLSAARKIEKKPSVIAPSPALTKEPEAPAAATGEF